MSKPINYGSKPFQDRSLPLSESPVGDSVRISSASTFWSPRTLIILVVLGLHIVSHFFLGRPHGLDDLRLLAHNSIIGTVHWQPCTILQGVDCGYITVPKDYFNISAGTATIALGRYNATKFPKKGTVFLNPGGPGGSGTALATDAGPFFAEMIGHQWDLVGFDPRGIAKTRPKVQCFPDTATQRFFVANTVLEQGFTVPSILNFSATLTRNHLIEQQRQFLVLKQTQAELCAKNMGDELKYMGTATVVRDIDFMAKVFDGKEAKINYWGGSYGSILGAYLVNMLPHRIGFATIDGIADPVSWSNEPSHKWPRNWLSSSEKTYQMFLEDCSHAGPALCPLTEYTDEHWENIEQRIEAFLDELALSPLAVPYGRRPGFLTSGAARGLILILLERPAQWPMGASYFAQAMAGNGTALFNMLVPDYRIDGPDISYSSDLSRLAVTCLDSPPPKSPKEFPTPEELADEGLKALQEGSIHFGMSTSIGEPDGGCQFWPVQGPERFTGPWNATLETPLLIVSNTLDPITPISSGLLINSLMPNSSRLIIQNGPGHTSTALPSLCTIKLVRQYYSGNFPENGTVCEVDGVTFPNPDHNGDEKVMSAEDQKLLESIKSIGEYFQKARRPGMFDVFR